MNEIQTSEYAVPAARDEEKSIAAGHAIAVAANKATAQFAEAYSLWFNFAGKRDTDLKWGGTSIDRATAWERLVSVREVIERNRAEWLDRWMEPATRKDIAAAVLVMMEPFPGKAGEDRAPMMRAMMRDLDALEPARGALWSAVIDIRRTSEFRPTVAAVVTAITTGQNRLNCGKFLAENLAGKMDAAVEAAKRGW